MDLSAQTSIGIEAGVGYGTYNMSDAEQNIGEEPFMFRTYPENFAGNINYRGVVTLRTDIFRFGLRLGFLSSKGHPADSYLRDEYSLDVKANAFQIGFLSSVKVVEKRGFSLWAQLEAGRINSKIEYKEILDLPNYYSNKSLEIRGQSGYLELGPHVELQITPGISLTAYTSYCLDLKDDSDNETYVPTDWSGFRAGGGLHIYLARW